MVSYDLEELNLKRMAAREQFHKFLSNFEDSVTPSRPALRKQCTPFHERDSKQAKRIVALPACSSVPLRAAKMARQSRIH
jgi:hypothetical protein